MACSDAVPEHGRLREDLRRDFPLFADSAYSCRMEDEFCNRDLNLAVPDHSRSPMGGINA
jgi:hypothetical protein